MTSDLHHYAAIVVSLFVTYLLHSTILLSIAWVVTTVSRNKSPVLSEHVWKFAAVAGLVTAPIQVAFGLSVNVADIALFDETVESSTQRITEADSTSEEESVEQERVFVDQAEHDESPLSDSVLVGTEAAISSFSSFPYSVRVDSVAAEGADTERDEMPSNDIPNSNEVTQPIVREDQTHLLDDGHIGTDLESIGSAIAVNEDQPSPTQSDPPNPYLQTAATIFVAFTLLGVLRIAVQNISLRRRLAAATDVRHAVACRLLDRLLRGNRVRRSVRLLSSSGFSEPVAFGLWHWTIVLPVGLEHRLRKEELRALLAHELAHLVRGDVWWLWVGRVLGTCFAFQPLNLLARNRWQQAAEYLCDDWAVNRGVNELSLARCLTQIAEWRLVSSDSGIALAASGPRKTIVRRVERLVSTTDRKDRWSRGWRRTVVGVACLATITAVCTVGPRCGFESNAARAAENFLISTPAGATSLSEAESSALSRELKSLQTELQTVGELLQRFPRDPEIQALAQRLHDQATRIRTQAQFIK